MFSVASGEEGVRLARTELSEAIVMDLQLHGIGGIDVTRQLKSDATFYHTPVLAIPRDRSTISSGSSLMRFAESRYLPSSGLGLTIASRSSKQHYLTREIVSGNWVIALVFG